MTLYCWRSKVSLERVMINIHVWGPLETSMSEVEGREYHMPCLLNRIKSKSHFFLKGSTGNDLMYRDPWALVIEGQSTLGSSSVEREWTTCPLNLICSRWSHFSDAGASPITNRLPVGFLRVSLPVYTSQDQQKTM